MSNLISHSYFLTCEHLRKSDKALRDWGIGSGNTLTIQVPAPLPPHVRVKFGPQCVGWANSKLDGQDTMIFLVDPSTETFDDLMRKVDARLNPTGKLTLGMTREGVKIRKHGSGWMFGEVLWSRRSTLASIGIQSAVSNQAVTNRPCVCDFGRLQRK